MGIKTVRHPLYSPDLSPCDFCLFPKLSLWDNWGDDEAVTKVIDTYSHKRTSMEPFGSCWNVTTSALQPEETTSKGTRVSHVYYQWKCPYEKSPETYLMIFVIKWCWISIIFKPCFSFYLVYFIVAIINIWLS